MNLNEWRIIYDPAERGSWNMAVDEAILEAAGAKQVLPTLRLYAWHPPCLSLGYGQDIEDVDEQRLAERGWGLVRRPTGGQAILHADELTYAVIGAADLPLLTGSIIDSYQRIASALLEALRLLGISAQSLPHPQSPLENHSTPTATQDDARANATRTAKGAVCFETPSNYEITVAGKKIIGSAQSRKKNGVLQHGSLPLFGALERITEGLFFADCQLREAAVVRLKRRATTIAEVLGQPRDWLDAAHAFQQAFEQVLGLSFQVGKLTQEENARAVELEKEKYAHPDWTFRKIGQAKV